jgi:peroxiredoxin
MALLKAARRWGASFWLLVALVIVFGLVGIDAAWRRWALARERQRVEAELSVRRSPLPAGTRKETGLPVGSVAPDFTLADVEGKQHRLADYRGKKTVLAFFCGCQRCAMMASYMRDLEDRSQRKSDPPAHLTIWTMPAVLIPPWKEKSGHTGIFLLQVADSPIVKKYAGHPCPRVYVLDPEGRILYRSPDPNHFADGREAVGELAQALDSWWVPPVPPASASDAH